jgi:hypothetical protein
VELVDELIGVGGIFVVFVEHDAGLFEQGFLGEDRRTEARGDGHGVGRTARDHVGLPAKADVEVGEVHLVDQFSEHDAVEARAELDEDVA